MRKGGGGTVRAGGGGGCQKGSSFVPVGTAGCTPCFQEAIVQLFVHRRWGSGTLVGERAVVPLPTGATSAPWQVEGRRGGGGGGGLCR